MPPAPASARPGVTARKRVPPARRRPPNTPTRLPPPVRDPNPKPPVADPPQKPSKRPIREPLDQAALAAVRRTATPAIVRRAGAA